MREVPGEAGKEGEGEWQRSGPYAKRAGRSVATPITPRPEG